MNKHTPGPWRIDQEFLPAARVDVGPEDGVNIFEVCCSGYIAGTNAEEELGNARLIAAAPEMYQLIENVAAAYEHDKSRHDLSATLYELRCKALQLLEKLEEGGTE